MEMIYCEKSLYFCSVSEAGLFSFLPSIRATEGTVAMVKARRNGSVNLVITQAIAKVPTVDEEKGESN